MTKWAERPALLSVIVVSYIQARANLCNTLFITRNKQVSDPSLLE
jgi:hypothetical protein